MLLTLAFVLQAAVPSDSVHASAAVRSLVDRVAAANHAAPPALRGYRVDVETELAVLERDTLGRERAAQLEQLASTATWRRGDAYLVHVEGYRGKSAAGLFSTLSFIRHWTVPTLYGERLTIGVELPVDTARTRAEERGRDTIIAVHPFASDRERYYRYAGGDTVSVVRTRDRVIHIVRLQVTPRVNDTTRLAVFDGEIDVDADRGQIVRMRGRFIALGPPPRRLSLLARMPGVRVAVYAEFVNKEVEGRYWMPDFQRTEFQSSVALFGSGRAVIRVLSRFGDYVLDERADSGAMAATNALESGAETRRTTWASADSVDRFGAWRSSLGDATASVTANDFDDVAPSAWRSVGPPRLDLVPSRADRLLHYNRVEGAFTGLEANLRLRSLAPGASVGVHGGWAWSERTLRGGVQATLDRATWSVGAHAERTLAGTNDFVRPDQVQDGGVAALLGSTDDYDYVDRRVALVSGSHVFGTLDDGFVSLELGGASDRPEIARLEHGLTANGTFRPNRGARAGSYGLSILDAELHPNVGGEGVTPGIGAAAHYEAATGELRWQRTELTLWSRHDWDPVTLELDGRVGGVFGSAVPPQQLFELGGLGTLSGYAYKQFVGDRAALFRAYAGYGFPIWRRPRRVWRTLYLPGLAPGLAVGAEGGWTAITSDGTRAAIAELVAPLGSSTLPVATDGVRASAGGGLTLFSGSVHLGVARPVDHPAPWRLVAGVGRAF